MKEVQVHEVREKLSKYLTEAERGEEIIITRHAKPVARLVAYNNDSDRERPTFPDLTEFRKSVEVEGSVLQTLLEMRREARY